MDLTVNYDKTNGKEEAYKAVKEAITPELLEKFQVKATLDYRDNEILANGKGFDLLMAFDENSCDVKVTLSFLLKPLKGKVLSSIEKQLKRVI